ncbi:tyrosine-type recombinase/integrase [Agrobacterium rhizogenes]|uniref:tyrosine-type recombinase/integrase n=1 Tax=Rhizobium rhizogenes TaxID=359 RepID=UPI00157203E1|nr:site-specific integrase [Rhizobium rhizogenes]NTG86377.1 tyrosine-type recombinase/integrase [Rhizobium rhizogenes]
MSTVTPTEAPRKKAAPATKRRLTRTVCDDAKADGTDYVIWDNRLPGFGLRVRPSGAKSFTYVYRQHGKLKRLTIKALTPEDAYDRAKELAAQHYGGGDPAAEKQEARQEADKKSKVPTVGEVLDSFVTNHAKVHLKPKTWTEYERSVEKLLKPHIGNVKIDALETKDVSAMYQTLLKLPRKPRGKAKPSAEAKPAVTQAGGAVRVLSSAMSWAEEAGLRPPGSNPARIRLRTSRRRTRLFSDNEVSRMMDATDAMEKDGKLIPPVALGIRLLFATGCRAGEICGLRWDDVDFEHATLRWADSKTGYLEKPMTDEARALLDTARRARFVSVPWVCPSLLSVSRQTEGGRREEPKHLRVETLEAGFERVMKKAEVSAGENATLHLIRHWFSTKTYTDKSIPLPVQMAIVGHNSVATAMRYAHVSRDEVAAAAREAATRRREAVDAAGKKGQVASMDRSAK